jgi:hypothetical protein
MVMQKNASPLAIKMADDLGVDVEDYVAAQLQGEYKYGRSQIKVGNDLVDDPNSYVLLAEWFLPNNILENPEAVTGQGATVLEEAGAILPLLEVHLHFDRKALRGKGDGEGDTVALAFLAEVKSSGKQVSDPKNPAGVAIVPGLTCFYAALNFSMEMFASRVLTKEGFPVGLQHGLKKVDVYLYLHKKLLKRVEVALPVADTEEA